MIGDALPLYADYFLFLGDLTLVTPQIATVTATSKGQDMSSNAGNWDFAS